MIPKVELRRLEQILDIEIQEQVWNATQLAKIPWTNGESVAVSGSYAVVENRLIFIAQIDGLRADVWLVEKADLSDREVAMVGWTFSQLNERYSEQSNMLLQLTEWLLSRLQNDGEVVSVPRTVLPEELIVQQWVPFLISCSHAIVSDENDRELRKLLTNYLSVDTIVMKLQTAEWVVLVPVATIVDVNSDRVEEAIEMAAMGLYEMLTSEWLGECYLSAEKVLDDAADLLKVIVHLKKLIELGPLLQREIKVYFGWRMKLELLLNRLDERVRRAFIDELLGSSSFFEDDETRFTLETFFELNCNVSDTAKQLYIHRNTLLYRLERIKNETNLDVRQFSDAVQMRLLLLLYKMTV